MRRHGIIALVAVLVAGLVVVAGQPARANDVPPAEDTWGELVLPFFNPAQPKCLDVPEGSTQRERPMEVFRCHAYAENGAPQRWFFWPIRMDENGRWFYVIENAASGLCLKGDGTFQAGTPVVQDQCFRSSLLQRWTLYKTPNFGPYFALKNVQTGLCMATSNSSGRDNTRVLNERCNVDPPVDHNNWIRQVWGIG